MNIKMRIIVILAFSLLFAQSCEFNRKLDKESKETIVTGTTTVYVDENIFPIIEDVVAVFENEYSNAKINIVSKSEKEILDLVKAKKAKIAILTRDLDSLELRYFASKNSNPKRTEFGLDAVAFITNKSNKDSLVSIEMIRTILSTNNTSKVQALVFDNPSSSNINHIKKIANADTNMVKNIYSLQSNKEVIKYVYENKNTIGIVGINWLLQPSSDIASLASEVKVMAVENVKIKDNNNFVKPNQSNIADDSYPLTRKLFLLNFQGSDGLGMGFASYLAGETGQRIILKSGLSPKRFPTREIAVSGEIK